MTGLSERSYSVYDLSQPRRYYHLTESLWWCWSNWMDMSELEPARTPEKRNDRTSVLFKGVEVTDPQKVRELFIGHPESHRTKWIILGRVRSLPAEEIPPPDGISMVMLKQLDKPVIEYLIKLLNLSLATLIVLGTWNILHPESDRAKWWILSQLRRYQYLTEFLWWCWSHWMNQELIIFSNLSTCR